MDKMSDREALEAALSRITTPQRTPEEQQRHDMAQRAATNIHDLDAVEHLRGLVLSDFAVLSVEDYSEVDGRLVSLLAEPLNALSSKQRTINGTERTAIEIMQAIPDVDAFLAALEMRNNPKFFEINEQGQLVIVDESPKGDVVDCNQAMRQETCIWYIDNEGEIQSISGEELLIDRTASRTIESGASIEYKICELKLDTGELDVIMESGLLTLELNREAHKGEIVRYLDENPDLNEFVWVSCQNGSPNKSYRVARFVKDGTIRSVSTYADNKAGTPLSLGALRVKLRFS